MMNKIDLSICVIGRNEAKNLPNLISSIKKLNLGSVKSETLYVDSSSSDNSVNVARAFFDRVYVLEESPHLSASAGRFIGTLKSKGEWILYLDGDMEIAPDFYPIIQTALKKHDTTIGYIGNYIYIFPNGKTRVNNFGNNRDGVTTLQFGGAVLLNRQAVLKAGNWDPAIYSNEEIELYTRLKGVNYKVKYLNIPMINHYTEELSKWRVLRDLFFPSEKGLGKKFYGIGQVLASRVVTEKKGLGNLIRFFPHPFIYVVSVFLAITFLLKGNYLEGLLVYLSGFCYISLSKGWHYTILYFAFIPQALLGFCRYSRKYNPKMRGGCQSLIRLGQSEKDMKRKGL